MGDGRDNGTEVRRLSDQRRHANLVGHLVMEALPDIERVLVHGDLAVLYQCVAIEEILRLPTRRVERGELSKPAQRLLLLRRIEGELFGRQITVVAAEPVNEVGIVEKDRPVLPTNEEPVEVRRTVEELSHLIHLVIAGGSG